VWHDKRLDEQATFGRAAGNDHPEGIGHTHARIRGTDIARRDVSREDWAVSNPDFAKALTVTLCDAQFDVLPETRIEAM